MPQEANPRDLLIGTKWVFVRKRNEKGEVTRFKARLVAQGFAQRPGMDFFDTYSPVMDYCTFCILISLSIQYALQMYLLDVVTAYLYGPIQEQVILKIPDGYEMIQKLPFNMKAPCLKLNRSLYGLCQLGRNWYKRLRDFLISHAYTVYQICPCVFIKAGAGKLCIVSVYVDDTNLIGTEDGIHEAKRILSDEFEMKDLGKTTLCLGFQVEKLSGGILIHQSNLVGKILKKFRMDECHPISTPLAVRLLDPMKDQYGPMRPNETVLDESFPCMAAIGSLMYLANCTCPDISFAVNLLARHSHAPTRRHWVGIKQMMR